MTLIQNKSGQNINPATDGILEDNLLHYKLSDIDDSEPIYMGYLTKDGSWYIQKITSGSVVRYTAGSTGYTWSNRASESYDTFDTIF